MTAVLDKWSERLVENPSTRKNIGPRTTMSDTRRQPPPTEVKMGDGEVALDAICHYPKYFSNALVLHANDMVYTVI